MSTYICEWPPAYVVKRHKRAMRVTFKVDFSGLAIVTPWRFSLKQIPNLLEKHRDWLTQQLEHFHVENNCPTKILPSQIMLPCLSEQWTVQYQPVANRRIYISDNPATQAIVLKGAVANTTLVKQALNQWLKQQSLRFLPERLNHLSELTQIPYGRFNVRTLKTRWGSCSNTGNITLSNTLILLPETLLDHVILHELCHVRQFNHSKNFWQLLTSFDSNTKTHAKLLRKNDLLLPRWITS